MPTWWTWKTTYASALIVVLSAVFLGVLWLTFVVSVHSRSPAAVSSVTGLLWGGVALILCSIFMLGAAQTPTQFLIYFGTGAFGAGMGYLICAWLTPTSGIQNPLDQVRNIVTGLLTGVVGTKLLTLWDDLVDKPPSRNGPPPIMTAPYYIPIIMWLTGFTVSLSIFYTIRQHTDDVLITVSPKSAFTPLGTARLGVLPGTVLRFSGAANSLDDVSVIWDFRPVTACSSPQDLKQIRSAFNTEMGILTTPTLQVLETALGGCHGAQDWLLTGTSNENRSRWLEYGVKFCRSNSDCVPPTAAAAAAAAISSPVSGGLTPPAAPAPVSPPAPAQPAAPPADNKGDKAKGPKK